MSSTEFHQDLYYIDLHCSLNSYQLLEMSSKQNHEGTITNVNMMSEACTYI